MAVNELPKICSARDFCPLPSCIEESGAAPLLTSWAKEETRVMIGTQTPNAVKATVPVSGIYHHLILHPGFLDGIHQKSCIDVFSVDIHIYPVLAGGQGLGKGRNLDGIAFSILIDDTAFLHIVLTDLFVGHVGYIACAVGEMVYGSVMSHDKHPVGSSPDIEFHHIGPMLYGKVDCRDGIVRNIVLYPFQCICPVGDDKDFRPCSRLFLFIHKGIEQVEKVHFRLRLHNLPFPVPFAVVLAAGHAGNHQESGNDDRQQYQYPFHISSVIYFMNTFSPHSRYGLKYDMYYLGWTLVCRAFCPSIGHSEPAGPSVPS